MKKILLLVSGLLTLLNLHAGKTIIRGVIQNSVPGEYIRIIAYRDFVSWNAYSLAGTTVDKEGSFMLTAETDEVMFVQIDAGFERADFYLEPDMNYNIIVHKQLRQETASYADTKTLRIEILSPGNSLTAQIGEINNTYNRFMVDRIKDAYSRMSRKLAGELENILIEKAGSTGHVYAQDYARYLTASLKLMAGTQSKNTLAEQYFTGQPILYNNIEYMGFFHSFFSKYLISSPFIASTQELFRLVNEESGYQPLFDTMARADYLREEALRELVLIKNLQELYSFPGFNQKKVMLFLEQLSTRALHPENRKIAANVLQVIRKTAYRGPSPKPGLTNLRGEELKFPPDNTRYTYLCIINPGQLGSLAELNIIPELIKTFSDRVSFVCINGVAGNQVFESLAQNNANGMIYALPQDYPSLIDAYAILRLPWFVLIDRQGNMVSNPAPSPSEDLAGYLNRSMKE